MFGAFTLDINKTLNDLNEKVTGPRHKLDMARRLDIFRKLTEIAWFHSHAIQ